MIIIHDSVNILFTHTSRRFPHYQLWILIPMCNVMQECDNPCCNASTCQRTTTAQCASGECCDLLSCQVKPYGQPCRESNGYCDIVEFCEGNSPNCPGDYYLRDGTECDEGNYYCFEGTCQTLLHQCQLHFSK